MRIERSMHPDFLSNTYLVVDDDRSYFVDAGGPVGPLLELAEREGVTPAHVLLTHHHHDHVAELGAITERFPGIEVLAHPDEPVEGVTRRIEPGEVLPGITALHTPGHTAGMLSFHTGDAVFTGDTLFKGSVGGVLAPGHTTYADLKRSIMDVLLALPPDTRILPGHTDATTVADELEHNRFVRIWRGADPEGEESCTAFGDEATLILLGDDYDGGHKAWIRWPSGEDLIVPGSQVQPRQ
jgi:hydroxyacylglutathione hydrolase